MNQLGGKSTNIPCLALTGCIGSGKSQAGRLFAEIGATLIDADILARQAVAKGSAALLAIRANFGPQIITATGELDRGALGKIVFSDPLKLKELNAIVHPEVNKLFKSEVQRLSSLPSTKMLIYVVPLYFESGLSYPEISKVIVVAAKPEICLARIMQRDNCTRELAEKKLYSQMPIEQKISRADYVIHNDGSLAELKAQVKATFERCQRDMK